MSNIISNVSSKVQKMKRAAGSKLKFVKKTCVKPVVQSIVSFFTLCCLRPTTNDVSDCGTEQQVPQKRKTTEFFPGQFGIQVNICSNRILVLNNFILWK